MKIAQVAPLYESVPPVAYGGTERVVSYLTEELVEQGHEVTLFASGDSQTRAELVPCSRNSLRVDRNCVDSLSHHFVQLEEVMKRAHEFDVIHFHIDYIHFPLSKRLALPSITTLHGRLDIPDLVDLYHSYPDAPVVSISNSQRAPLPFLNWQGTVYHGIPKSLYRFSPNPKGYLAFLGRISPEKGIDRAIEIAEQAGVPLKIAAKVDKADQAYFEEVISPLLRKSLHTEFIGEIAQDEKSIFLGGAKALLFPINWQEPFGLVMIEAMACGTPVIAYPGGSVTEVIDEGQTGFIVESIHEAVGAIERVNDLSRIHCRNIFEKRFSAERMAKDYVRLYENYLPVRRPRHFFDPKELSRLSAPNF